MSNAQQTPSLHLDERAYPLEGKDRAMVDAAVHLINAVSPHNFAGDNLITFQKTVGFINDPDPDFMRAAQNVQQMELVMRMAWRLHTLTWASKMALKVEGDFIECGVFMGFKSCFLAHYLNFGTLDRRFHLFDTFEGRPEKYPGAPQPPGTHQRAGLHDYVVRRFSPWPNFVVHKGMVPDDVDQAALPEKIAYLHLDMNAPVPERAALEMMFDRMPPGADQKVAADDFFRGRVQPVMELPTGQGVVVKCA
jgi:O-methyltransferase